MLQFRVFRPVFVQDEQQFLCSTEGEDREEDTTTAFDDRLDEI
jgi:hypothetical protein